MNRSQFLTALFVAPVAAAIGLKKDKEVYGPSIFQTLHPEDLQVWMQGETDAVSAGWEHEFQINTYLGRKLAERVAIVNGDFTITGADLRAIFTTTTPTP